MCVYTQHSGPAGKVIYHVSDLASNFVYQQVLVLFKETLASNLVYQQNVRED